MSEDMFDDLGRFETGAVPVEAVMRRGRKIRVRRRVFGTGALAGAAALAIVVPVAVAGQGGGGGYSPASSGVFSATSTGTRVVVNPTPVSHGKAHFSGAVDGKKWNVDFDNKNCYNILWACGSDPYFEDAYASLGFNASDGQPYNYTLFLRKNVASTTITLQDGEVLHLEAVPVAHSPVALFAVPHGLGIRKIELYDAKGAEIASSYPFSVPGSLSVTGNWYKPGEKPSTATGSVELAREEEGGRKAIVTAYVGPAGPCIVRQMAGFSPDLNCGHFQLLTGSPDYRPAQVSGPGTAKTTAGISMYGLVAPNIDHMNLVFSDGTTAPVTIKSVQGYRFYTYSLQRGNKLSHVIAYDKAGKPLPVQAGTE